MWWTTAASSARELMRDFAFEIVLATTSLPLATYPDALLAAAAEVEAGRPEEAPAVPSRAPSTVVIEEVAIPLPPLGAKRRSWRPRRSRPSPGGPRRRAPGSSGSSRWRESRMGHLGGRRPDPDRA